MKNRNEILTFADELIRRVVEQNFALQYFTFRPVNDDSDIVFELIYTYVDGDSVENLVVGDYSLTYGLRYYRTLVSIRSMFFGTECKTVCDIERGEEISLKGMEVDMDRLTFMLSNVYMMCTLKTMETYFQYSLNKI